VGTLMGILPSIAAIFTIIWTSIRIYESNTVQNLIQKMKGKNNASS
jgi:chromate transport protein ChrA